jgi:glucokinase
VERVVKIGIGIDLGGTAIKGTAFDCDEGRELERGSVPAGDGEPAVEGVPKFAQQVRSLVSQLEQKVGEKAEVLGLSAPGMANSAADRIEFIPNRLDGLQDFDWGDFLDRQVAVVNDAHAALLGEIWLGSARGLSDVILLTLGTGVGGAVVTGGKLLRGHLGRGGHLGHISLDYLGDGDICGTPGSLEDLVGNATIAERSSGRFAMTRDLVAALESGDEQAREIWDKSMRALAAGVASLINVLDPQAVILGGGISTAWDSLQPGLQRWLDQFEWRPGGARVEIRRAELGEWAGSFGALAFALDLRRGPM